jgi:hypothetical protein
MNQGCTGNSRSKPHAVWEFRKVSGPISTGTDEMVYLDVWPELREIRLPSSKSKDE